MVLFFFFLFGIIIGSFLNVCISRIPEGQSIVSPSSRCHRCLAPIKPYDNVPILGWLLLRGKCRACALPISPMYPLIELATGLLFVACYLSFGLTVETCKWLFFSCVIIILTITDLRVRLLPDAVTLPGFIAGLIFASVVPPGDGTAMLLNVRLLHGLLPERTLGVVDALLGAAFGSLLLWGAAALPLAHVGNSRSPGPPPPAPARSPRSPALRSARNPHGNALTISTPGSHSLPARRRDAG